MSEPKNNPFSSRLLKPLEVGGSTFHYYSLPALSDPRIAHLPYSIKVLLESAVRNADDFAITAADVENILAWETTSQRSVEIPFKPARVLMQDFTGVPAVVDLAAMRNAMARLGGDPARINPLVPADLVVDHSVQVDFYRTPDALEGNLRKEMQRNSERFAFLKWGSRSLKNFLIVPPGSGIVHQVNLEFLARVVFEEGGVLYPDSVVGTDSHTTMINGLGVVGWGVGGIEAEAVMLGQPISMVLPEVIGYKLTGKLPSAVTATDLVLTITERLRQRGVVDKGPPTLASLHQHLTPHCLPLPLTLSSFPLLCLSSLSHHCTHRPSLRPLSIVLPTQTAHPVPTSPALSTHHSPYSVVLVLNSLSSSTAKVCRTCPSLTAPPSATWGPSTARPSASSPSTPTPSSTCARPTATLSRWP